MFRSKFLTAAIILALGLGSTSLLAQDSKKSSETEVERIAFFGVWEQAKTEAKESGKPIFLLSAAPQCKNVPGIW